MPVPSASQAFWRGLRHGAPFVLVVAPFALVFGVVGVEAGLSIVEVMGFSVLVIAGASQLAALQLMIENAPTVLVLATALAVNLRMAMYSAALTPHLGAARLWQRALVAYFNVDQSYAMSVLEYERRPDLPLGAKIAYFFGVVALIAPVWYGFTLIGAVAGTRIPPDYALDFAVPIAFLSIVAPALRTLAHVAAAATSVVMVLALGALPAGLGLILAGLAAMMVGARVELWQDAHRR